MNSGNTHKTPITIESVNSPDTASEFLAPLCDEWSSSGLFWGLESCRETMAAHQTLSAAAVSKASPRNIWVGWYLATCQGPDCELLFIYTKNSHRGSGLGKTLLNDLISRAMAAPGVENIFLEVRFSNTPAINLYEQLGFVRQSIRPRYYSNGEDALVYRLSLKK